MNDISDLVESTIDDILRNELLGRGFAKEDLTPRLIKAYGKAKATIARERELEANTCERCGHVRGA